MLDGAGAVQTLGPAGFNETPVERGSLLWFTPGLIHRLINHGDLEIIVLMQIATLPEAGDCFLSFPEEVLADRKSYLEAAGHDPGRSVGAVDDDAARRRRDLAVNGFNALREGEQSLDRFYELAAGIAAPLVPAWRDSWETGPGATAGRAGELISALEDGGVPPLAAAMFGIGPPAGEVLGLCGRLNVYPSVDGVPVV